MESRPVVDFHLFFSLECLLMYINAFLCTSMPSYVHQTKRTGVTVCCICRYAVFLVQHASADVERMLLGNKCDMEGKRVISKEQGETVRPMQPCGIADHSVLYLFFFLFFN